MGRTIGIDLGTTNTAVAVLDGGRPRVLEDAKGYKVLPSVVWIGDDGETVVGQSAKNLLLTDPTRTVYSVKRVLGRHFDSDVVADARGKVGYEITTAEDGTCLVEMAHGSLTPVEVSAHVLRTAKEMAENALDEEVTEAVITVPAYFNHAQRAATMEAAKLAGLHCERLLNEPTAAALAYGFKREVDRTLVIFDLGGGTFDVSALRLSSGVYEILSTLGDSYLGGEDFDYQIVDHLAEAFLDEHGVDLREDRVTLHRLKDAAERAKCELSFTDKTTVLIPQVTAEASLEKVLDRVTLEGLVEDYIERAISVTRQAVADAGLQISAVDEVILVGGQTRMPRIREAIAAMFDKEPSRSVHPEEVVAIGAAVHAASLTDENITPAVLIDVTPFDLGIDVAGGMFQPIIQRNSTIPASAARVFATAQAQQTSVRITVRQGASRMAGDNEFLGEFIMGGLTPAPRMETKVEVNFKIDANGMLHVTAMEPATGKSTEITVRNYAEVAESKGQVQPKVSGADAVARGAQPAHEDPPPKSKASEAAPVDAGPSPKKKTKAKTKTKAKAKAKGGGLLGALFGRVSKKQAKGAAVPAPDVESLQKGPAGEEPSIIEAVAAERIAASEDDASAEPLEELAPEALDELGPEALDELSADDIEEGPLFESHAPDASSGIVLPELEAEALESLEAEAFDDLDEEDPFASSDSPASVSLDGAAGAEDDLGDHDDLPPMEDIDESALEDLGAEEDLPEEDPPLDLPEDALADDTSDDPFAGDDLEEPSDAEGDGFVAQDDPPVEEAPADGPTPVSDDEHSTMFDFATVPEEEPAPEPAAPEPAAPEPAAPEPEPVSVPPAASPFTEDETVQVPRPSPAEPEAPPRKKPAKLKLSYKRPDAVVREYRENLERGGCFVKTAKPLAVDREVRIEVRVPGLDEPIVIPGVVTWSSRDAEELEPGQEKGMGIEYQLDDGEQVRIGGILDVLERS